MYVVHIHTYKHNSWKKGIKNKHSRICLLSIGYSYRKWRVYIKWGNI